MEEDQRKSLSGFHVEGNWSDLEEPDADSQRDPPENPPEYPPVFYPRIPRNPDRYEPIISSAPDIGEVEHHFPVANRPYRPRVLNQQALQVYGHCHHQDTIIIRKMSVAGWAVCFCMFCFFIPGMCIPFCIDECYDNTLYCTNCRTYL